MMITLSRRNLLQTWLAGATVTTLAGCGGLSRSPGVGPAQRAGAVGLPDSSFAVAAIDRAGQPLWQTPVDTRCHGGCRRPASNELVFVERRPGWSFYVLDDGTGARLHRIEAGMGEHFVGHGVFSPNGQQLYLPASRYDSGEGIVAVYDAGNSYRRVQTLELNGIGPHELTLHPDGQTLVIGLGGILTHPDYDRIKLNLATMQPALMLMDRHSGEILARFTPSHHQLSCRHVDVSPNGAIYAAYQYQGPRHETPPLVACYRGGQFEEIDFGDEVLATLGNYLASVVAHPENNLVAVTSPIGGTALIFNGESGQVVNTAGIPDCAGVQAVAGGDFLVSSGQGKLVRFGAHGHPIELATQAMHWDHHLV